MPKCCVCKGEGAKHQIFYTKYYRDSDEETKELIEPIHLNCFMFLLTLERQHKHTKETIQSLPMAMTEMRGGCENYGIEEIDDKNKFLE